MPRYFSIGVFLLIASCGSKNQYDPSNFYTKEEQQWILSRIIAHISTPPQYVLMKDRLKPEHETYYWDQTIKFDLLKFSIGPDSTHYYLVRRPAPGSNKRAVGGTFKFKIKEKELTEFKEVFVTPALEEPVLTERADFLFDQLVKGDVEQYLKMPSYVQWPNKGSYYDTVSFEWKIKLDSVSDN